MKKPLPWNVTHEFIMDRGDVYGVDAADGMPVIPKLNVDREIMRLIAAAPELLAAQTMGVELNTPDFLDWIAARLVEVHGENPNVDYIHSLKARAAAGRAAIAKATGSAP